MLPRADAGVIAIVYDGLGMGGADEMIVDNVDVDTGGFGWVSVGWRLKRLAVSWWRVGQELILVADDVVLL